MKPRVNANKKPALNLIGVELYEGDSLVRTLQKKLENKEAIPVIMDTAFTDKKIGVVEAYNIRTDRFEVGQREAERIGTYRAAKKAFKTNAAEPAKATENSKEPE